MLPYGAFQQAVVRRASAAFRDKGIVALDQQNYASLHGEFFYDSQLIGVFEYPLASKGREGFTPNIAELVDEWETKQARNNQQEALWKVT